eukprot:Rhum_TRINITY_DN25162_c0_g1::Rhum_TRINITY_DN25162_c0_g1_i1::g.181364::m.181364
MIWRGEMCRCFLLLISFFLFFFLSSDLPLSPLHPSSLWDKEEAYFSWARVLNNSCVCSVICAFSMPCSFSQPFDASLMSVSSSLWSIWWSTVHIATLPEEGNSATFMDGPVARASWSVTSTRYAPSMSDAEHATSRSRTGMPALASATEQAFSSVGMTEPSSTSTSRYTCTVDDGNSERRIVPSSTLRTASPVSVARWLSIRRWPDIDACAANWHFTVTLQSSSRAPITSFGPYTAASTFVPPATTIALPSAPSRKQPSSISSSRGSVGLRPSRRSPARETYSTFARTRPGIVCCVSASTSSDYRPSLSSPKIPRVVDDVFFLCALARLANEVQIL